MVKSRKGGDPSVKRSGKSSYPWVWKCFWGWKGFVQFTMTLLIPLCVWMLKLKLFDWNCEAKVCELEQEKIKEEMEKKKNKGSLLIESAEAWHWDRSEITVCVCTCMSMHCLVCPEWCQIEPPPVFQRHASICWWVCGLGVCTYMINTLACTSDFYAALCGIRYLLCAPVCD